MLRTDALKKLVAHGVLSKDQYQEHPVRYEFLWSIAIGLVAGGIVGLIQWLDLRLLVSHSLTTIASQAIAWSVGAVILGTVDGLIRTELSERAGLLAAAGALFVAGATVGLIHGAFVQRMLPSEQHSQARRDPAIPV